MIVLCSVPLRQRKSHLAELHPKSFVSNFWGAVHTVAPSRWVRCGSAGAGHVTAIAHVIVRHEQLTGKSLEVKKAGDALGNIVEHAELIGEVLGKHYANQMRTKLIMVC